MAQAQDRHRNTPWFQQMREGEPRQRGRACASGTGRKKSDLSCPFSLDSGYRRSLFNAHTICNFYHLLPVSVLVAALQRGAWGSWLSFQACFCPSLSRLNQLCYWTPVPGTYFKSSLSCDRHHISIVHSTPMTLRHYYCGSGGWQNILQVQMVLLI